MAVQNKIPLSYAENVFLTKTFYEQYPNADKFVEMWNASPFNIEAMSQQEIENLYYQLVSEYMMSHFAFIEPLQIDLQVAKTIYNYYPNLQKKLQLQQQIIQMTDQDLQDGNIAINSSMSNPDTDEISPSDASLPYTSQKSLQTRKYSKPDRYTRQYNLLVDGLYDVFIKRFKPLFITLIVGTNNMLSMNNDEWNEDLGGNDL